LAPVSVLQLTAHRKVVIIAKDVCDLIAALISDALHPREVPCADASV